MVEWYYINRGATDRRLALDLTNYKSNRQVVRPGGYFCVLLLLEEPIEYPSAKHVIHRLRIEINNSVVSITQALLSLRFLQADFSVIRGHSPLLGGPTAYRSW